MFISFFSYYIYLAKQIVRTCETIWNPKLWLSHVTGEFWHASKALLDWCAIAWQWLSKVWTLTSRLSRFTPFMDPTGGHSIDLFSRTNIFQKHAETYGTLIWLGSRLPVECERSCKMQGILQETFTLSDESRTTPGIAARIGEHCPPTGMKSMLRAEFSIVFHRTCKSWSIDNPRVTADANPGFEGQSKIFACHILSNRAIVCQGVTHWHSSLSFSYTNFDTGSPLVVLKSLMSFGTFLVDDLSLNIEYRLYCRWLHGMLDWNTFLFHSEPLFHTPAEVFVGAFRPDGSQDANLCATLRWSTVS